MTNPETGGVDRLHYVLLRPLDHHDVLTTAELRRLAHEVLDGESGATGQRGRLPPCEPCCAATRSAGCKRIENGTPPPSGTPSLG